MYLPREVRCSPAVGEAWDHHVAHPHGDVCLPDRLHKGRGGVQLPAGDLPVTLSLMVLYVVEHQVGVFENVLVVTLA